MANFYPVGKVGANKIYTDKSTCEISEGQECFDISGIDLETHDLVDGVLVENPTKVAEKQDKITKANQVQVYEFDGAQRRTFGQKLINITTGFTGALNLSAQDSLALATSLNQIITLCTIGRIDLAKAAIQAYTPDQYFTQEFKDLLLWEINRNGF